MLEGSRLAFGIIQITRIQRNTCIVDMSDGGHRGDFFTQSLLKRNIVTCQQIDPGDNLYEAFAVLGPSSILVVERAIGNGGDLRKSARGWVPAEQLIH